MLLVPASSAPWHHQAYNPPTVNTSIEFNTKINIYTFEILMKHSMVIEEKSDPKMSSGPVLILVNLDFP